MYKLTLLVFVLSTVSCEYKYETKWFKVPLDHFGFQRNETFKIKYLTNEEYWDKDGGPIFFYAGNELSPLDTIQFCQSVFQSLSFGSPIITISSCFVTGYDPLKQIWVIEDRVKKLIGNGNALLFVNYLLLIGQNLPILAPAEVFAKITGFMWDIASEFKAMLVFAEHRYYGKSMPFGNKSLDNEHIGYLTAAQALADFADLINYLQGNKQTPTYPVIAFGGSYGGILASYFRIKYPHLVTGAIASSAPVHMYPGMVPCEFFYGSVTSSFKIVGEKCANNIRNSWSVLRTFLESQNNRHWLYKNWNLCDPIETSSDVEILMYFLKDMYETLSMVNYPFEMNFAAALPAHPVRFVCQFLNETLNGPKLIKAIGKVLQVYSNYHRKPVCVNYKKGGMGNIDMSGWHYQKCTEMIMPKCTNGKEDMFEPSPWNITKYSEDCYKKYNVYPQPDLARIQYGGDRLQAASNIVFSNGLLDPWAGGGILKNIGASVKAVVIADAAHHQDLMPSNPADSKCVKKARNIYKQNIHKWIKEFRSK